MQQIQLVGLTPEENRKPIFDYIDKKFEDLKQHFQPKEPTQYLTRQEVAEMLSVDLSTIWHYTKKKKLIAYGIGSRVYYKRQEVENAIVELKK